MKKIIVSILIALMCCAMFAPTLTASAATQGISDKTITVNTDTITGYYMTIKSADRKLVFDRSFFWWDSDAYKLVSYGNPGDAFGIAAKRKKGVAYTTLLAFPELVLEDGSIALINVVGSYNVPRESAIIWGGKDNKFILEEDIEARLPEGYYNWFLSTGKTEFVTTLSLYVNGWAYKARGDTTFEVELWTKDIPADTDDPSSEHFDPGVPGGVTFWAGSTSAPGLLASMYLAFGLNKYMTFKEFAILFVSVCILLFCGICTLISVRAKRK